MTPEAFHLFRRLADGRPLNGAQYAAERGISRAAVWKQVEQLRRAGLPVAASRGRGYQLAWPIELLDADSIRRAGALGDVTVAVRERVDSTNRALADSFRHRHAVFAEYQERGRGRRGRGWISPPGCGIWASFGFRFDAGLQRLGPLSLVAGIAAAGALRAEGAAVGLKWPNDLVVDDDQPGSKSGSKLGGLLVEIRGASEGPCDLVIGVGINARLPRDEVAGHGIAIPDQPWTDLFAATGDGAGRNRVAGRLVAALDAACGEFERTGFGPFAERWKSLDVLAGRRVRVLAAGDRVFEGRAAGITRRGMLRVARDGDVVELDAGEVSVRAG